MHRLKELLNRIVPPKLWKTCLILLLAVGAFVWLVYANRAKQMTDPAYARKHDQPIPVRTALVSDSQVEDVIGATGVTAPSFTAIIRVPPSGGLAVRYVPPVTDVIIKTVNAYEGQRVSKGQVLFEVENEFFEMILAQRKTALAAAETQVERAKQAIEHNRKVREKEIQSADAEEKFHTEEIAARERICEMLHKLEGTKAANVPDVLDAKVKLDQARYDRSEAQRRLAYSRDANKIGPVQDREELTKALRELDLARVDLEDTRRSLESNRITSPLDGYVENMIDVAAGQTVGLATGLARVLQLDPIFVRLDFPQERADDVALGDSAEVSLDCYPGEVFTGKVVRISSQVNTQTRCFPVVLETSNPQHRIKAGVTGFARLRRSLRTTRVPSAAVIRTGNKSMVFRVEEGRARMREVRTGRTLADGSIEIREGLAVGDEVVVYSSNFYQYWGELGKKEALLLDEDRVNTDWTRWARRE